MASAGFAAKGVTFTWDSNLVGELTNVSGPGGSATEIDITNHDSTGDYKEFVMGLLDAGEISLEANFVPGNTGQADMIADFNSRALKTWSMVFPDTGSATFSGSGYVKSYSVSGPVDGKASISFTVRITGVVTFTP